MTNCDVLLRQPVGHVGGRSGMSYSGYQFREKAVLSWIYGLERSRRIAIDQFSCSIKDFCVESLTEGSVSTLPVNSFLTLPNASSIPIQTSCTIGAWFLLNRVVVTNMNQ